MFILYFILSGCQNFIENTHEENLINKLKECDAIALRTARLTE